MIYLSWRMERNRDFRIVSLPKFRFHDDETPFFKCISVERQESRLSIGQWSRESENGEPGALARTNYGDFIHLHGFVMPPLADDGITRIHCHWRSLLFERIISTGRIFPCATLLIKEEPFGLEGEIVLSLLLVSHWQNVFHLTNRGRSWNFPLLNRLKVYHTIYRLLYDSMFRLFCKFDKRYEM